MESLKESIGILSAAIIGSFIGTATKRNDTPLMMAVSVASGISSAYIFTPIIIAHFDVGYRIDYAVAFLLGLFGMSIISIVMAIMEILRNNPKEIISFIKDIFIKSESTTIINNNYKEDKK